MPGASMNVVESGPLRYLVSTPRRVGPADAGPLPLLCFLHGYDEAAPLPIERGLTRHGPLAPASSALARERFVVVAPQLPRSGDIWNRYGDAVMAIVAAVQDECGGDPARAYLTGFSFGGNGVFELALRSPVPWAALWAVDPTRPPPRDPGLPVWLSAGEAARARAPGFVRALDLRPTTDSAAASAAGERVYVDEGLGHVESAASAYADDRIYAWLLGRSTRARS